MDSLFTTLVNLGIINWYKSDVKLYNHGYKLQLEIQGKFLEQDIYSKQTTAIINNSISEVSQITIQGGSVAY